MGNGAPNCKNLTSPSVAVFLQDYIKSALNTLIQAAYCKWRRAAKWHEPAFSQFCRLRYASSGFCLVSHSVFSKKRFCLPRVHLEPLAPGINHGATSCERS